MFVSQPCNREKMNGMSESPLVEAGDETSTQQLVVVLREVAVPSRKASSADCRTDADKMKACAKER